MEEEKEEEATVGSREVIQVTVRQGSHSPGMSGCHSVGGDAVFPCYRESMKYSC